MFDIDETTEDFVSFLERVEDSEAYSLDELKVELCEKICSMMERQGVTKAELARRLTSSRAYVTKILQGSANLTLESLVKIGRALQCSVIVDLEHCEDKEGVAGIWEKLNPSAASIDSIVNRRREVRLREYISIHNRLGDSGFARHCSNPDIVVSDKVPSAGVLPFVSADDRVFVSVA